MGKRVAYTPKGQIRNALRNLWLRSRERAAAIKRDKYTCQRCGAKQSVAKGREVKVEVHHKHGVDNWDKLISSVYECLLCHPDNLETLCKQCHSGEKDKQ